MDRNIGNESTRIRKENEEEKVNKEMKKDTGKRREVTKWRTTAISEFVLSCSCSHAYELKPVWPSGTKLFLLYILVGGTRRD
jgi:hypothetical protein